MNRKVVKQGAATLMVSLPSKWAKKWQLKKGDEVSIEEHGGDLIISKKGSPERKSAKISLENDTESSIRTAITNAYRSGLDVVEVQYNDEKRYRIIRDTIKKYLIGFEIIKKENNSCIIENITEPSEEQFDVLLKKIFSNTSSLIAGTEKRLQSGVPFTEYPDIVYSIHQYENFCRRVMSKRNISGIEANLFWTFLTHIIHGQRELYHLNKFLDKEKFLLKNSELISGLKKMFSLLTEAWEKKDRKKIEQIHELEKKLIYHELYASIQKGKKENIALYHIAFAIKNFYFAASPLVGLSFSSNTSG